jgi:hypothetical protein
VESEDGFSVKWSHRNLTYTEGGKSASVDIEHSVDTYKLIVYSGTLKKWHPPFQSEAIGSEERSRIIKRVSAALEFLGLNYSIEQNAMR